MTEINFAKVEKKWQEKWDKAKVFESGEDKKKPKYYVLEMFPYPSGSGLHMGHAWNYTIGDIIARFKIMKGFNVLHPMGYDSLGLPAENAAIEANKHPDDYTNESIPNFVRQQKAIGLSYDWTRMISSHDSSYYKWDQWIFLKMLEKGLAYQKTSAVNWCSKCNTVLANEQVHDGKCWRHEDTEVEVRQLKQWFLKTTEYADELYENLDKMDWPDRTKAMQKNWIGKSHGTEIDFSIEENIGNVVIVHGSPKKDKTKDKDYVWDSKKAWIGWTKKELKKELKKKDIECECPQMPTPWKPKYSEWKKEFEKIRVDENSILVGTSAGGGFLVRWLGETKKKVRKLILISPGKVGKSDRLEEFYGDKFYKEVKDLVKEEIVIYTSEDDIDYHIDAAEEYSNEFNGKLVKFGKGYGHFTSKTLVSNDFPELLSEISGGEKWPIFTTRPDTIFGVTFMVVAAQHPKLDSLVTEEQRKDVDKFLKKLKSVSEKDIGDLEKEGVFTGSYAVNPANGEKVPVYAGNFVVADYGAGMVMAVPAHDQRDFEFAKKYKIDIKQVISGKVSKTRAWTGKGELMNSGEFDGLDNIKAKHDITEWLIEERKGRRVTNFKLRDWGISRQRYWGTPIPVIHCEKCGAVPVPEKDLPVELPKDVKFGKGNPLETNEKWLSVKCPKCGGNGRRESDTMDTFVNSSWYFLRYCDPKNDKKIFDVKKVKYWCPVDTYIGGAEHACMHLIYSRFYVKFLRDLGLIDFDEPAIRLFHQGMLRGEGGVKMSKSKPETVVLPGEVSNKYGIDTARFFLSSLASPDKDIDWSEKGISGSSRFIKKVFKFFEGFKNGKDSDELFSKLNKTIKNVGGYYDNFEYRKATIEIRELFDLIEDGCSKDSAGKFLQLLSPICPHITEELWAKLGNKTFISTSEWPKAEKVNVKKVGTGDLNLKIADRIKEIVRENTERVYVYVMPFELDKIDSAKISKKVGRDVGVYSVSDPDKHDPENKAKKAKPGKAAIYLE